ncbi:MAG TPA: Gfo/Idh/MocA family oxidoreductase [Phycisphaerales bacterium]|nr:Gfo/Idh/MocA family oxidoreductase [Phycisphaerales bacterium]
MLNVAQIGVGYWGPNLLRNLIASKQFEVKRVIDLNLERQDFVRGLYPAVSVSDDVQDVFDDDSIEAVVIATPVETHYDLAIQALDSGKHVLVEKPMAKSTEQIQEIADLAQQKGLVAMVGHTFLYNPAVRYIKKYIDEGHLGELRYICSQRLNLGRIRSDVDALWNLAPHDISIIQYLVGDISPVSVSSNGMDYIQDGINDVTFMNITYPSKVVASVHVSWLDPRKVRQMIIVGSEKMIVYDDMAESKIAIYDKGIDKVAKLGKGMDYDIPGQVQFDYRSGDIVLPKIKFEEPLKCEIEHFADCITNGTPCLSDAIHAKGVVEILGWDDANNKAHETYLTGVSPENCFIFSESIID